MHLCHHGGRLEFCVYCFAADVGDLWHYPVNDWIVAHFISSEFRSRVYAVKSVLALGIGAIAVQVTGRLHEQTGSFDALFIVMAGCAATVLIAALFLIPARRSAEHGTAAAE